MKDAVIIAHPNAASLTCAIGKAYASHVRTLGHRVVVRDLYRTGFDPRMMATEIPGPDGCQPGADVVVERGHLADADAFVLVYPFWFNAPPAVLKGYIDRVFSMGFGYTLSLGGGSEPLLEGKRLISFSTSGAPETRERQTGALAALMTLFDEYFSAMCGLQLVDHVHNGGTTSGMRRGGGQDLLDGVRRTVDAHFGGLAVRERRLRSAT